MNYCAYSNSKQKRNLVQSDVFYSVGFCSCFCVEFGVYTECFLAGDAYFVVIVDAEKQTHGRRKQGSRLTSKLPLQIDCKRICKC